MTGLRSPENCFWFFNFFISLQAQTWEFFYSRLAAPPPPPAPGPPAPLLTSLDLRRNGLGVGGGRCDTFITGRLLKQQCQQVEDPRPCSADAEGLCNRVGNDHNHKHNMRSI